MLNDIRQKTLTLLRRSERYTKTDMVYLVENGFWLQSSSAYVALASFVLYVIFGHYVSKDAYGTYQYLLSLGVVVSAFTLTGMSNAVTRSVAQGYEGTYAESIRVQLLWSMLPTIGSWALGGYYLVHSNPTLGWGLLLVGLFVPIGTVYNTYGAYLSAKKDFRRGFLYNLAVTLPYYIAVALVAISIPAALALLAANTISQTLGYYVAHRRMLRVYRPDDRQDPNAIRYGTHLSIMLFLNNAISKLDDILTFHFLGAAPLALYSFATAVPGRLGFFKSLASLAFPKYAEKTYEEVRMSLLRKSALSIGAALVIAIVYDIVAHWFFLIFFPNYMDAVAYSQVYAFFVVVSFGSVFVAALTAQGRTHALYAYNLIAPLILLGCEVFGIVYWGLWGLVVGKVAATLFGSLLAAGLFLSNRLFTRNAD